MFYKIQEVKPLAGYNLLIKFNNNIIKQYNVEPLFDKWEDFQSLITTVGLFEQVKVDTGGYGVSWNDYLDLSCNELWNNGKNVESLS